MRIKNLIETIKVLLMVFLKRVSYVPNSLINIYSKSNKKNELLEKLKNIDRKPIMMDIGAAGSFPEVVEKYIKEGLLDIISFDPNINWGDVKNRNLIDIALSNKKGKSPFYSTLHPGCSSCLEPNFSVLNDYKAKELFEVQNVIELKVDRFDNLYEKGRCGLPDFVKIDAQGFDYECLEGFGKYLKDLLAIKLEAQYKQIYKEQKLIFEIIPFLNSKGFKLRDIKHQGPFGDELVEANVFFTRAPRTDVEKTFLEFWEMLNNIRGPKEYSSSRLAEAKSTPPVS